MIDRATKLRWRRRLRRGKHHAVDLGTTADEHLERHFLKRLSKFSSVRRFIAGWVALLILLIIGLILQTLHLSQYYQTFQPTAGGVFHEGIVGTFTNANPLYATGTVDAAVSKLIFSSLLKYDQTNKLIGDLAESWSLDAHETLYTVKLRPNLKWHDGRPLTSADVVFTYKTIQNADAKSPLLGAWRDIVVEAPDSLTVVFHLPSAFSAFPYSLTNGIVPKHLLENMPIAQLRSSGFNTISPVGSGPFKWQTLEVSGSKIEDRQQQIGLSANENYYLGAPKLNRFVLHTYTDSNQLATGFSRGQVQAATGLSNPPEEVKNDKTIDIYSVPMTSIVMAFFNNSNALLADSSLRRALVLAARPGEVTRDLGFPVIMANEPILKGQLGYNPKLAQISNNTDEANKTLDSLGWVRDPKTGLRARGGHALVLKLISESNDEYALVTQLLQKQWRDAGIDLQVTLQADQDLQATIASHGYDILLYGISLGVDPDAFAYWHSSQADIRSTNRLNFSEYKSAVADKALEAGRNRSDPNIRVVKYKAFLEAWRSDNPALALYQPRFLYLVRKPLFGLNPTTINQSTDRFNNVSNWAIREKKVNK